MHAHSPHSAHIMPICSSSCCTVIALTTAMAQVIAVLKGPFHYCPACDAAETLWLCSRPIAAAYMAIWCSRLLGFDTLHDADMP